MKNKHVSVLLVACLALSMAACGSHATKTGGPEASVVEAADAKASETEATKDAATAAATADDKDAAKVDATLVGKDTVKNDAGQDGKDAAGSVSTSGEAADQAAPTGQEATVEATPAAEAVEETVVTGSEASGDGITTSGETDVGLVAEVEPHEETTLAGEEAVEPAPATSETTEGSLTGDESVTEEVTTMTGANAYRIVVVDQYSQPVVGAMVQFCTSDTCKMAPTDESGMAVFDDPEAVYEVHILKAPEGYKPNETLYTTSDTYGDLVIMLEAI